MAMLRFSGGSAATSRPNRRMAPLDAFWKPAMRAQEGGLAASGGAEDGDELAGLDGEVDAVQHRQGAVADMEVLDLDRA